MTLTSAALKPAGSEGDEMDDDIKYKIIKTTRGVCIKRGDDANPGEVRRVPANIANILIGDGSAESATEKDLEQFEKKKGKAAAGTAATEAKD